MPPAARERLALERIATAENALDLADDMLERARHQHTYAELGGPDRDTWVERQTDLPTPADQRQLAQAAAALIATAVKVDEHETGGVASTSTSAGTSSASTTTP